MLLPQLSLVGMLGGSTPPPIPPVAPVNTLGTLSAEFASNMLGSAIATQPMWTSVISGTDSQLIAGIDAIPGIQHFLSRLTLSTPDTPIERVVTVYDGATPIYEFVAIDPIVDLDFRRTLRSTVGQSLSVVVGDVGAINQTLSVIGFSSRSRYTYPPI